MNPINKSEYLFLFRGPENEKDLSPADLQRVMTDFIRWVNTVSDQGILKGSNPLERRGKVLKGKTGEIITDGPYIESKEFVGGYFLLAIDSMEEALEIAKGYPLFEFGWSLEIREVAEMCSMIKRAFDANPAAFAI